MTTLLTRYEQLWSTALQEQECTPSLAAIACVVQRIIVSATVIESSDGLKEFVTYCSTSKRKEYGQSFQANADRPC